MQNEKRPTVADVAERAGVSIGTVSNVLTGIVPVKAKTRDRVAKAILDLDYRQNMLAQGLRAKRSPIVGVCVPHTSITYFSSLANAFEEVASNNDFQIMQVLSHQDPDKEYRRVKSLLNYRVGGLILVPSANPERSFEMIQKSGIAVVVVDRAPEGDFPFDRVTFNNRAAMTQIGEGLAQRGHRNILFIVHQRKLNVTQQRVAALEEVSRTFPEKVSVGVMECGDQSTLTALLSAEMRKAGAPTALIVSNSRIATWAFRAFRALQVRCPEDMSLVAFDEPEWADIVTPSLSVVRQPTHEMALMAWRFLLNRMSGIVAGQQEIRLEAEVIFRHSVADLRGSR
jgi:LacI family transcriptional regulator